jgi:hypothetical protein
MMADVPKLTVRLFALLVAFELEAFELVAFELEAFELEAFELVALELVAFELETLSSKLRARNSELVTPSVSKSSSSHEAT